MRVQVLRPENHDAGVQPVSGELPLAELQCGERHAAAHHVHRRHGEREVQGAGAGLGGVREESDAVCWILSKCSRGVFGGIYNGFQSEGADGIDSISESLLQFHGGVSGSGGGQETGVSVHVDFPAARQAGARISKVSEMEEVLEDYKEEGQSRT